MEYNYVQEKCLLDTLKVLLVWFFIFFFFLSAWTPNLNELFSKKKKNSKKLKITFVLLDSNVASMNGGKLARVSVSHLANLSWFLRC